MLVAAVRGQRVCQHIPISPTRGYRGRRCGTFAVSLRDLSVCIECDAVFEHVRDPEQVMRELIRVLAQGGHPHLVTPFSHPFHQYPCDYRRFTPDGLKQLAGNELELVAEGWRTGPTATLSMFLLECVKLWLPWRAWRILVHGILGWLLFPFRYLDLLFFGSPQVGIIGNTCYIWIRKR